MGRFMVAHCDWEVDFYTGTVYKFDNISLLLIMKISAYLSEIL